MGPGFAELLRRYRARSALSQEELASRAGLTAKAVGALERGQRRRPYPHTVRSLADALTLDDDESVALAAAARGASRAATAPAAVSAPTSAPARRTSTRSPTTSPLPAPRGSPSRR